MFANRSCGVTFSGAVAVIVATMGVGGCNRADLTEAPAEAPETGPAGECPKDAVLACDAAAPVHPSAGCVGDPASTDPFVRRLPADARAPVGCVVNVPDPVPNEFGECLIAAACTCVGSVAAAPGDAGADAARDASADPSPWSCKR